MAAAAAPTSFPPPPFLHLLLIFFLLHFSSSRASDSEIILKFKTSISDNTGALASWNSSNPPCNGDAANWNGVLCSKGTVWGLQLENMGLKGVIDIISLKELKDLRTLSFMNNRFQGPMPELKKLLALKSVYLSGNQFSGEIPVDAFEGMVWLKKVFLGRNLFSGEIPSSLTKLPKLLELRVEGNQFQGRIPNFEQKDLQSVNVSNNVLEGEIPARLSKMDSSLFAGNKALCGPPLQPCPTPPPKKFSLTILIIVLITAAVAVAAILFILLLLLFLRRRRQNRSPPSIESPLPPRLQKKSSTKDADQMSQASGSSRKAENARLAFVIEDRERFELQDLLKASAEILGNGSFYASYTAAMAGGVKMVVKRFKKMNRLGKEEFQEHMRRVGRLRHPNLLPLVAYFYRKEEKLLISDYVETGSLAVYLHGPEPSFDWPTRLKIIKGIAKGVAYLHKELPTLTLPHGHLKSSTVLLSPAFDPLLTDYALIPVINPDHAESLMVAFKSPDFSQNTQLSKKTDLWSLGILILEILTGRSPENLAAWVGNCNNAGEVFDEKMGGNLRHCEGEMMKMLRIGLGCCEEDVEKRMELKEAVERIEEVKEKDLEEDFYSSCASDQGGDAKSSRGFSDDFSSFTVIN